MYSTAKKKRLIRKSLGTIFDHSAYKVLFYSVMHGNFIFNRAKCSEFEPYLSHSLHSNSILSIKMEFKLTRKGEC
jgi:hypothetical protein